MYNKNYLDVILLSNIYSKLYDIAQILLLQNFSSYNKKYGWTKGDNYLKSIAHMLVEKFPQSLVFRISGDDFVILGQNKTLSNDIIKRFKIEDIDIISLFVNLHKENISSFNN